MCSNPTASVLHSSLPGFKSSIVIDNNGRACLTDTGLLTIISEDSTITSTAVGTTTAQWMSPELLFPDKFGLKESNPTRASDCYSLGMVIYEVLSGQTPFFQHSPLAVAWKVPEGERPRRPEGDEGKLFTDKIWEVLERCWKHQPGDRLSAKAVLTGLKGNLSPLGPPSGMNGDAETEPYDRSDDTASGSGMFSPFHPRLTSNRSRDLTALPTTHGDNGPSIPSWGSPRVPSPVIPGQFLDPPQVGNLNEGWIGDWLVRNARRIFNVVTR